MKKLLFLPLIALACFSSCYKEKTRAAAQWIVTDTVWKIDKHVNGNIYACGVPAQVVFMRDSTGYYYYPTKCEATDPDTLRFRWRYSDLDKNVYLTNVNGDPKFSVTVGVSDFSDDILRLRSGIYKRRLLDGYFVRSGLKP